MPLKIDKVPIQSHFLKRSAKLLPCQKEMVLYWHNRGISINKLAKMFHVSKRLIQFVLFPERAKKNIELRQDRGGSAIYYKKDKHTDAIREHRAYKKHLFKNTITN
jgi:hypothetical protein